MNIDGLELEKKNGVYYFNNHFFSLFYNDLNELKIEISEVLGMDSSMNTYWSVPGNKEGLTVNVIGPEKRLIYSYYSDAFIKPTTACISMEGDIYYYDPRSGIITIFKIPNS